MKKSNWLKVYIIDVLPILLLSVYLLGIVYLESFYTFFGIEIFSYIGLETSLAVIIEPLIIFMFALLPFVAISSTLTVEEQPKRKKSLHLGRKIKEKYVWARMISEWNDRHIRPYSSRLTFYINKIKIFFEKQDKETQEKSEEMQDWKKLAKMFVFDVCSIFILIYIWVEYFSNKQLRLDHALLAALYVYGVILLLTWLKSGFRDSSIIYRMFNFNHYKGIDKIIFVYRVYAFMLVGSAFLGLTIAESRLTKSYDFTIYTNTNDTLSQENYYHIEHIGNVDFLMDKKDSSVIVVNNENIVKKTIKKNNFMHKLLKDNYAKNANDRFDELTENKQ